MITLPTTHEEVFSEFPIVLEWIDVLQKNILKKDVKMEKSQFVYGFGFFVKKSQNNLESYMETYEKSQNLLFDERLQNELNKVRVSVTFKIGDMIFTNRLPKGVIPEQVKKIVTELTKVKMTIEGYNHGNQEVIDSIPPIDTNVVKIKEFFTDDFSDIVGGESEPQFDIDDILDKISRTGMDSLTKEEIEFLDKKSKNL